MKKIILLILIYSISIKYGKAMAIHCYDIGTNAVINNNTITNVISPYLNNIKAIWVENINPVVRKLDISHNTLHYPFTGIWVINIKTAGVNKVTLAHNKIYFNQMTATPYRYGIRVENCNNIEVSFNEIYKSWMDGSLTYKKMRGISIAQTTGGVIHDNSPIYHMGSGIRGVGDLTNTQFSCNDIKRCYYGFYFDPPDSLVATTLSNQGNNNRASDNYWTDSTGVSYRVTGKLSNYPTWYFRGALSLQPYSIQVYIGNPIQQYITPHPNTNFTSQCMDWIQDDANNQIAKRQNLFGKILQNQIQYTALDSEFVQYNKELFYESFKDDTTLLYLGGADDADYQSFYNQLKNSNFGEFADVRKLLDTADFDGAKNKNDNINPHRLIELNRKTVMAIYLSSLAQDIKLDSVQTAELMNIALMTPYIGGDAVYSARVMLGIDPDEYGTTYRVNPYEISQTSNNNSVLVYPNPTKDEITIDLGYDFLLGNAEINIYGLLGNRLITSKINEPISKISVQDLSQGVYTYNIIVNNNCIAKDKLVIIK